MTEEIDYNIVKWQAQLTSKIHRDLYPLLDPHNNPALSAAADKIASTWVIAGSAGVVITGRNADKLRKVEEQLELLKKSEFPGEPRTRVLSVPADVTKETKVANLWSRAGKERGQVNVVVNNAGTLTQAKTGEDAPANLWRDFEVNVKGAQLNIHHFLARLPSSSTGTVLDISTGILGETYPNFASISPANSLWLCTERAEWLRGGLVSVNWDFEEMEEHREEIWRRFGKGGHSWAGKS
ncbi:hypothetical protein BU25DRAFT_442057 [Macroventuria anomochaeta]|uniref:Uncharacterized protein n=1 Tax=Macroventuria anomochaeta TaxID=301207 RepID=A0ACB6RRF1_9PLEO|nr:uncharacterized protein BU25DRAFT_442057 [Macroventuria anomochaeta]KAF2624378.1 hypothetical protein BU25DRAFT_442057 [Macroventuria anomochaeta]